MKFILHTLAVEVYQSIGPVQIAEQTEAAEKAKQLTLYLAIHSRTGFMEQYCKATKPRSQTACVHATLSCAVNLADKLQQYMAQVNSMPLQKATKENCLFFYRAVEEELLLLLQLLETDFQGQFNTNQKLPDHKRLQVQPYFLQTAKDLDKQTEKGVNTLIVQLLTALIRSCFQTETAHSFTYGLYGYWKTLLAALPRDKNDENAWIQILVLHNFNHGTFIHSVMEKAQEQSNLLETDAEKTAYWAQQIRGLNRLQPLPALALYKNAPACKQLLLQAMEAERALHEKQWVTAPAATPHHALPPIETTLTLNQLAALLRLLVETDILICHNHTQLMKNIARTVMVRNQKTCSPESLRQKYYQPDTATISILKTHLTNMLTQLRKYTAVFLTICTSPVAV